MRQREGKKERWGRVHRSLGRQQRALERRTVRLRQLHPEAGSGSRCVVDGWRRTGQRVTTCSTWRRSVRVQPRLRRLHLLHGRRRLGAPSGTGRRRGVLPVVRRRRSVVASRRRRRRWLRPSDTWWWDRRADTGCRRHEAGEHGTQ